MHTIVTPHLIKGLDITVEETPAGWFIYGDSNRDSDYIRISNINDARVLRDSLTRLIDSFQVETPSEQNHPPSQRTSIYTRKVLVQSPIVSDAIKIEKTMMALPIMGNFGDDSGDGLQILIGHTLPFVYTPSEPVQSVYITAHRTPHRDEWLSKLDNGELVPRFIVNAANRVCVLVLVNNPMGA